MHTCVLPEYSRVFQVLKRHSKDYVPSAKKHLQGLRILRPTSIIESQENQVLTLIYINITLRYSLAYAKDFVTKCNKKLQDKFQQ